MKTKVSACSIRTQDQWETRLKLYQLPYKYRYIWKYNFIQFNSFVPKIHLLLVKFTFFWLHIINWLHEALLKLVSFYRHVPLRSC